MDDRLESGFGGWADEKIQTAREAPPLLGRKKSYPQHLTISLDLIHNSYGKPFLSFSQDVFTALKQLKDFNYTSIYKNAKIKTQNQKIESMFEQLFGTYCGQIKNNNENSTIYQYFLKNMPPTYTNNTGPERKVIDFISGMTDHFFNNQFQQLFVPTSYGYTMRK
jgi:dGTPase